MIDNGCRWEDLEKEFGSWSAICSRFRRWVDNGAFDRIERKLQAQGADKSEYEWIQKCILLKQGLIKKKDLAAPGKVKSP